MVGFRPSECGSIEADRCLGDVRMKSLILTSEENQAFSLVDFIHIRSASVETHPTYQAGLLSALYSVQRASEVGLGSLIIDLSDY